MEQSLRTIRLRPVGAQTKLQIHPRSLWFSLVFRTANSRLNLAPHEHGLARLTRPCPVELGARGMPQRRERAESQRRLRYPRLSARFLKSKDVNPLNFL